MEYNKDDRATMEENIDHFGLHNIQGYRSCGRGDHEGLSGSVTGIYGGISSMEQEIAYLTKLNPKIKYCDLYP